MRRFLASLLLVAACSSSPEAEGVAAPGVDPGASPGSGTGAPAAGVDGPGGSSGSDGGGAGSGGADASVTVPDGGGPAVPTSGCGKSAAAGTFTRTIVVGGTSREYVIKIPAAYDASVAHPLFFSFHGAGSNGAGAIGGNDVIAGVPSIKVAPTNGDVAVVKSLVDLVKAELCVDNARIFATGYSAGGFLSDSVACSLGDTFRGAAVWEGGGSGTCPKPVAMWFNHNQDDTTVPLSYGTGARDGWLQTNGCSTTTQPFNSPDPCVRYSCTKASVVWCSPATGGHKPPYDSYDAMINFFSGL